MRMERTKAPPQGGQQSLTAPTQPVMGAQQTPINFLTSDIADVKIYVGALGDSDRVAEENALICKSPREDQQRRAPSLQLALWGNVSDQASINVLPA